MEVAGPGNFAVVQSGEWVDFVIGAEEPVVAQGLLQALERIR
jgi:hypothetical protein